MIKTQTEKLTYVLLIMLYLTIIFGINYKKNNDTDVRSCK